MKFAVPFAGLAVVLFFSSATVRGQSALDGFDPNANGTVRAVVVQPDGKILIGGDFTTLAPNGGAAVTRNQIARLNPDGTLDAAFNPNANGGVVYAIALQADGKVLVGGIFTTIGGQPRRNLARLDGTTGAADSFNPNPNSDVLALAVQADSKILVGGDFNQSNGTPTIGGQTRNNIARLDATSGLADSFNPNANGTVDVITVQADGRILVGGNFSGASSIGGQTRNRIARLNAATGLADPFDPNAAGAVLGIAVQADGRVVVCGDFFGTASIGGQPRNYLARLDPVTGLADGFDAKANGNVRAIAVQADGKILAGGTFAGTNSIGGQARTRLARLDPATGLADSFDPNATAQVLVIALQPDDKVLVAGQFTFVAPNGGPFSARKRIARLEKDGGLDQTLNHSITGAVRNGAGNSVTGVYATAIQPDGKILIGGAFTSVDGAPRTSIARLNADGTLDTFNPAANSVVRAIAVLASGQIVVGGDFSRIGGQNQVGIAWLDPVTGLADSSKPSATGTVECIAIQADGQILVGGDFTGANSIGGQSRNRIARLNSSTGQADSFDPNAQDEVYSIAVQPDGRIVAAGHFSGTNSIGSQPRNYLARLDPATGLADSFDPSPDNSVFTIAVQPDGKILVGGPFSNIGGQNRIQIARFNSDGTLDTIFHSDLNIPNSIYSIGLQADGEVLVGHGGIGTVTRLSAATGTADFGTSTEGDVLSVALQGDGKILAGGRFFQVDGIPRTLLARLTNDTPAQQSLTVTQSAVAWVRGGSSPQFTRVTFEASTDNITYTPLGRGTPSGSNWTLTGLSLPARQNIYVRARGHYGGSLQNGSENLVESVRNAFITLPPTPSAVVSRKIAQRRALRHPVAAHRHLRR